MEKCNTPATTHENTNIGNREPPDGYGKLGDYFQAIDHVGSGGNSAVIRGLKVGATTGNVALKLLDPRCVKSHDREREYRKFDHANLVKIQELTNLFNLGLSYLPRWFTNILDCDLDPFVPHSISSCNPTPGNWRQKRCNRKLDTFAPKQFFLLVMDYCPTTLSEYVSISKPISEAIKIVNDICLGVKAMHSEGIIHTDLSTRNILINEMGVIKIADFGLSENLKKGITQLDRDPDISAPELAGGEGDERSDIYSLGLLTFQLATGKDLLRFGSLNSSPANDFALPGVPSELIQICQQASEHLPWDRFNTVEEFQDKLTNLD